MQFSIYTHGIDLTEAIKRQTYKRLDVALDCLESDVESIHVRLVDTNGPFLGGVDKACQIIVALREQDTIVVEDIDETVDAVLDRTTDRLGVIACQRLDSLSKQRKRFRGYVDSDDSTEFRW